MGGGGQSQTTTESKEVKLPAWVDAASQANYARAQQVANRPYAAYGGPTTAKLDPLYTQARAGLSGLNDMYGNYGAATQGYQGAIDYNPTAIDPYTAAQFAGTDLSPYLNPYINEVERNAISNAERTGRIAQRDLASKATGVGGRGNAFGGSRHALQAAVQGAETTRGIGDLSAQLRSQGYDKATGLAQADIAARNKQYQDTQQAQIESERQKLQDQQNAIQASQGLTTTADAGQKARMNEIMAQLGIGQIKQEQTQREYDDRAGKWQKGRDYPLEQLNILMSALGMSPYGHSETGTSTTKSSGGGGMGGMLGMLPGLMQMMGGFASDRDLKTNIEPLGVDPLTKLEMYAYDYKSDVKASKKTGQAMPKRVGPMAQDVEKKYPKLVRKVGGKRVIDLTGAL